MCSLRRVRPLGVINLTQNSQITIWVSGGWGGRGREGKEMG